MSLPTRVHLTDDGRILKCSAKIKCKYFAEPHFDSVTEAEAYIAAEALIPWNEKKARFTCPDNWGEYQQESIEYDVSKMREVGFESVYATPYWSEEALNQGLIEVELDEDHSLLLEYDRNPMSSRRRVISWMTNQGKSVAMVSILISPPGRDAEYWGEPTIGMIEVAQDARGQGYATRIIKEMEKAFHTTLYTSGHYTPEGFATLHGKIPLTSHAQEEIKQAKEWGHDSPIGVQFKSMTFVEDWKRFYIQS